MTGIQIHPGMSPVLIEILLQKDLSIIAVTKMTLIQIPPGMSPVLIKILLQKDLKMIALQKEFNSW